MGIVAVVAVFVVVSVIVVEEVVALYYTLLTMYTPCKLALYTPYKDKV